MEAGRRMKYGPMANRPNPSSKSICVLRYELMPYIYSLGHFSHETGAPFMRGLFMDFGDDPKVANIGDEYMFGPALLVAPVTEQGRTTRDVYLPAGADWYNFWTNERVHGGSNDYCECSYRRAAHVCAGGINSSHGKCG